MRLARCSGRPGWWPHAAVLDEFSPKYFFIPLFIIFTAACLVLAGCTEEEVTGPGNGNGTDDPICPDELPYVEIVTPSPDDGARYPPRITFTWRGAGEGMIARTRYLLAELEPGDDGIARLNDQPELFEDHWTRWEILDPEGRTVLIGEDDPLDDEQKYLFAVQALDSCGRKTEVFRRVHNARQFTVGTVYPVLSIMGIRLGSCSFIGTHLRPAPILVPPGVPLSFIWNASNTYSWFGPIEYRYGWDVQNLGDDDEWMWDWNPWVTWSFGRSFYSGVHVFYAEARDEAGTITRARIEIEVIPFPMDRDLLWIDDFRLGDSPIPSRMYPTEAQHDSFWTEICSLAPDFDPVRDICPADELYSSAADPLPLTVLSHHRHVIWTYDNSQANVWKRTIRFVPESEYTPMPMPWPVPWPEMRPNNFALYLAAGGSALTCGRGDRNDSALGATFPLAPLLPASIPDGIPGGPAGENAGKYSMAYDDYYVTVVDKVIGCFTDDLPGGVMRIFEYDAFRFAYTQNANPLLPDTLTLSDYVTAPGMFFDPQARGFYFVEVYDPEYYMDYKYLKSRRCFSPLYWMRTRSLRSPLDHTAVALRTTLYECEPNRYPPFESFHFGLPLWYIDHGQVEQIADYIFQQWSIR